MHQIFSSYVVNQLHSKNWCLFQLVYVFCTVAWDLLRICLSLSVVTFFKQISRSFCQPSTSIRQCCRIQYKRSAGGKLDAINYPISRAAQLIKETVSTHHSSLGYRNQSLDTSQAYVDLKRKKHNKYKRNEIVCIYNEFLIAIMTV